MRLLVVDDVLPNRLVARALLEQAGHAVTEAGDGTGALAALQAGPPPDAVLMDVNMASMDGHAATRRIRGLDRSMLERPAPVSTMVGNPRRTRGLDRSLLERPAPVSNLVGNPRRLRKLAPAAFVAA